MIVSVIITTYNWPAALNLTLQSLLHQSRMPDEVIVADDGSGSETARLVAEFAANAPFPTRHSWQEDRGFRLAMSRNRAIARSEGEYIIVIDGDLILHPHFIRDHLTNARKKRFLQGGRVLLGETISQEILTGKKDPNTLCIWSHDIRNRKNALRNPLLSRLFSLPTRTLKGIKGCNFSLFKEDILTVNGFDNRFVGWGREDSEFVARLYHNGVQRKNLKFAAVAYHLYHPESERSALSDNDRRLSETLTKRTIRCEDGVNTFLHGIEQAKKGEG
ncbi:glycosyltransferase family 2 protein [Nitratifractor sp.]